MAAAFSLLRPLIHCLPPETAHNLGISALRYGLVPPAPRKYYPVLTLSVFGHELPHPLGLAAGFDKNALAIGGLLRQGFAFVEAGTVTPLPQPGNPKPRIFRLGEDEAVINRLGFNNEGLSRFVRRFAKRRRSLGMAGANIGMNKTSNDAVGDYLKGLRAVYPHADYVTVNISSPNTPGLRDLQEREPLNELLSELNRAREGCMAQTRRYVPLLLKVAPDLDARQREAIASAVLERGIDGMIISNTTVSRPAHLASRHFNEAGGLSGKPLFALSTETLKAFYKLTGGKIPLIGVGGIASGHDAYVKIRSGATLLQLYSALVYQGFGVVKSVLTELDALLKRDGYTNVRQAIGVDVMMPY